MVTLDHGEQLSSAILVERRAVGVGRDQLDHQRLGRVSGRLRRSAEASSVVAPDGPVVLPLDRQHLEEDDEAGFADATRVVVVRGVGYW